MTQVVNDATHNKLALSIFGTGDERAVAVTERSRRLKYWKQPKWRGGWVTVGPDIVTDPAEYRQYVQFKKMQELPDEFGIELVNAGPMSGDKPGRRLEPFVRNGGLTAKDEDGEYIMPASQIVAYNWHRDETVRKLRPDVANVVEVECRYGCIDGATNSPRVFAGINEEEALQKERQHSRRHARAIETEAVGKAVSEAIKSMPQFNGFSPEQFATLMAIALKTAKKIEEEGEIISYPEGEPDKSWTRQELRAWCIDNGIEPLSDSPLKHSKQEWLDHIYGKKDTA